MKLFNDSFQILFNSCLWLTKLMVFFAMSTTCFNALCTKSSIINDHVKINLWYSELFLSAIVQTIHPLNKNPVCAESLWQLRKASSNVPRKFIIYFLSVYLMKSPSLAEVDTRKSSQQTTSLSSWDSLYLYFRDVAWAENQINNYKKS